MPEVPYLNALARSWRTGPVQGSPINFHRTLPGYAPTPLTPLPALARELISTGPCPATRPPRSLPCLLWLASSVWARF